MGRSVILAAMALVLVPLPAMAGDKPLYAPVPDWVKPTPPLATGADAPMLLLLDQQQRLEDGQVWAFIETATRIASADALAKAGTITLGWQPDDGDLIVHRATILRGAEQIDLLKGEGSFTVLRRESQLESLTMDGVLTATLAAEGLRVGDVLRVAYSVTRRDRALKGDVQAMVPLIGAPLRVGFARARLVWKPTLDLRYRSHAPGAELAARTTDGYREIDVALPLAKAEDFPDDAPIRLRPLPLLEASSFADWPAVSKAMAPLYHTDNRIAAGSPLAAEVAKIAAASPDARIRAAASLRLVQDEIRYLARGMEGGNYIPQTPTQTWSVRYGDCKAKTLMLLAILRALKIEAEPVLVHSAIGDAIPKRLPMPAAFDHVLVRAVVGDKTLWLDGTRQGDRLADIDDTPGFVWALPVRDAGAALMPLPRHANARPDIVVALDLDQSAGLGLPALFRVAITLRGQMAGALAMAAGQVSSEQRKEMLQGIVNRSVAGGQLIDQDMLHDQAAGTVTVSATGLTQSGWVMDDKRFTRVLDRAVSELTFEPDRVRPAWRELPVATQGSGSVVMKTKVKLPLGGKGFTLDGDTTLPLSLAGAGMARTVLLEGGVVTVDERVDEIGSEISPGDIDAVRSRLALAKTRLLRVQAPADYPARWQVVTTAREAGALKPIEAAYTKAIAADPKAKLPYENRGAYRAGTFDWRGAIADFDRAIAIEPSISLYTQRARMFERAGDKAKALADAETAFGLDTGSLDAVNLLNWLRAANGKRDVALAMIDERIAAGGKEKTEYLVRKAEFLVQAGRGAEAVAATDAALLASPGNAAYLNDRCWTKATANLQLDTALKDCSRSIELGESPAGAFDSRALVYYRLGRDDEALDDLNAALDISPGASDSLFLRGIVRSRRGETAAATIDLAAARMMDPRVDETYARWGIKP